MRPIVAAAIVVVIAAALIAGVALSSRRQEAGASPQPSALAVRGSPTTANLAPDGGRDLVVDLGGHSIGIRTESATAPFFKATSRTPYAVSPTGTLAYWKTGPDDALPHELHVYDTTSRTDRTLLTLTDERGGSSGFMVWSTDGTGIAFGTSDLNSAYEGRLAPARPTVATWWLLDVGTGVKRKISTISGAWIMPVSWDRVTDSATAGDVGRDGPDTPTRLFYVWEPLRARQKATVLLLPASIDPLTIHADSAGGYAVGLEPYGAIGSANRNIWTWPLRDPTAGVPRKIPGRLIFQAQFRPGTTNVYALMRNDETPTPSPGLPLIEDLGPLALSGAREVYRTPHPGGDYFFFRSDGSAIVVGTVALNDRRGAVVDPETGASTVLAIDDDVLASIGPPPARTIASPSPLPTQFPSGSPLPTQPPAGFATPEEAADAIKGALEGTGSQSLTSILRPAGWYAQWLIDSAKTDPMSLGDAYAWNTAYPNAKRSVDARPIADTDPRHPLGEKYIRSLWLDFGGYPEQRADIMLGRDGGRWFWTSMLLYRPPPISPGPGNDSFTGYATLLAVTDAAITVRFRTVGARCCSDQSWDRRTVVLRSDSMTIWFRADGTRAPAYAATGATTGTEVWVQFAPSTLLPGGTYRLDQFAKMYP